LFYQDPENDEAIKLRSPFIHAIFMNSKEQLKDSRNIECALARLNAFCRGVISNDIDIVSGSFSHVEKPYMSKYLNEKFFNTDLHKKFTDVEVWNLINDVWTISEFNCGTEESSKYWREIFSIRDRPDSMIIDFPENITVYRGGHVGGFSWTEDLELAKWFQNRNAMFFGECDLLQMEVTKRDILFSGNREEEVVINPKTLDRKIQQNEVKILDTNYN